MRFFRLFFVILMTMCFAGCSSNTNVFNSKTASKEEVYSQLLEKVKYAEITKSVTNNVCIKYNNKHPICKKFMVIPNKNYDDAILPILKEYVSIEDANKLLEFYSKPETQRINDKLISNEHVTIEELNYYDQHNEDFAKQFRNFIDDKRVNDAIDSMILNYQPK